MKILLLLMFSTLLFANKYPYFTKYELNKIDNRFAKNRIIDYQKTVKTMKSFNKKKQLGKTNIYLNQLLSQYDKVTNNAVDHWATPKEFLRVGYGDCEDYAIIKYYTLIKLGFDEKKLYLTVVKEKYRGSYHMVLSYFKKKNTSPLILDNLSFRILPLQKRTDIKDEMFINSTGIYKLKNNRLVKAYKNHKTYNDLLKRIKKNL